MLKFYYSSKYYPIEKNEHCVAIAKFLLAKAWAGITLKYYTSSHHMVRTLHAIIASDYRIRRYVRINIEGEDVDFNYYTNGILDKMKMDKLLPAEESPIIVDEVGLIGV